MIQSQNGAYDTYEMKIGIFFSESDIDSFIDIASSAMGEDTLAAYKTTYLLQAMHGYAPLIYNYGTKECKTPLDYNTFLSVCEDLWKKLKEYPNLSMNMVSGVNQSNMRHLHLHYIHILLM